MNLTSKNLSELESFTLKARGISARRQVTNAHTAHGQETPLAQAKLSLTMERNQHGDPENSTSLRSPARRR